MTSLGARIKALRLERDLQQRQLAEKAELTPSMVSQIESGRLTPSLNTLGKIAAALGVPIATLFDGQPAGRIQVTRKKEYPVVSFDGSSEKWTVLGAGLFEGKIRAVVSTLDPRAKGVKTEKVLIKPGQMKLFYVLDGTVGLHYNGGRQTLEAGDSALLDGGLPHGWENLGTLAMDVREDGGLRPGYELKLNSYDLGVDIELYDAIQRLRFEHPEVGAVILTSAKERVFCAGANIRMLGKSSHGWKVNFCKFTNETRNALEESSAESGQAWVCMVNGPCAGGGYELALACRHIVMADDGNTSVALPEVPLLAVLPGTGGLTRLTDKRKVRRDRADYFCTLEEGVKGKRA
ncbi:MAG: hypothetical protein DMD76_30625, partial [Candidatus Rokuibacteriota bacterium]